MSNGVYNDLYYFDFLIFQEIIFNQTIIDG